MDTQKDERTEGGGSEPTDTYLVTVSPNKTVYVDLGRPVRFLNMSLPIARQFITDLRRAANMVERHERDGKANGRHVRSKRRRVNS